MSRPHIVLVHGAYHQSWHWHLLKSKLEEAGHRVSTPALPSAGNGVSPAIGLKEDKEAIKLAVEKAAETAESILPVFHSYAGVPGSEAAAELSQPARDKIVRLVYVMAFVIDQGTSLTDSLGGMLAPWAVHSGGVCSVPRPVPTFYNDVSSDLAQAAAGKVVQQSLKAFLDKAEHAGWKMYPATYVMCSDDKALDPEGRRRRLEVLKKDNPFGFNVVEMATGHSPFLSQIEETAAVIQKEAGVL
ncbi:alpha/beta hydrolase [Teratosphaeria destructans]|uniref:Alpha/beta hydrolase n=1 Tax=Teratosphaeria destructans TaxID=418781 RepID=A0A9W7W339_9PEZI|nr:alpha/beta hydrolase [Teratosphaeria destructans]